MTFGVIKAIYRGAKRTPMNTKRGHNYYKGTGSGSMGWHTKRGGYKIDPKKVRTYVVPNLTDCPYLPYVEPKAKRGIKYTIDTDKYLELANKYVKKIKINKKIFVNKHVTLTSLNYKDLKAKFRYK
ncbi:unnamed protein product [Rhizophagus irregularis]|nr:unnamed protein product [Rhizophagus irregularis]